MNKTVYDLTIQKGEARLVPSGPMEIEVQVEGDLEGVVRELRRMHRRLVELGLDPDEVRVCLVGEDVDVDYLVYGLLSRDAPQVLEISPAPAPGQREPVKVFGIRIDW